MEIINDAIFIHDIHSGAILAVNYSMCRLFGYSFDEAVHLTVEDLSAPEQPFTDQNPLQLIQEAGRGNPQIFEWVAKDKSGRLFYVEVNLKKFTLDTGDYIIGIVRDITGRKENEISLSQLSAIVAYSDDAITGKTLEGIITTWNKGAEKIYGYRAEEAIGQHVSMLIPPERFEEVPQLLNKIRKGERVHHFETTRVRKDGQFIRVSITESPIMNQNGMITGASTIARDITENILISEALSESEARFRSVYEGTSVGIALLDAQGRLVESNPAFKNILGYDEDKSITLDAMTYQDDVEKSSHLYAAFISGSNSGYQIEKRYCHKDGHIVWVRETVSPGTDHTGKLAFVIVMIEDISQAVEDGELLRKLSKAVEYNPNKIIIASAESQIEYVNRKFLRATGLQKEEVLGKRIREVIKIEISPSEHEMMKNHILSFKDWKGVFRSNVNGGTVWEAISISPIRNAEKKVTHFVVVQEDITSIKKAEIAMQEAKEAAENANKAKSEFLASMSHEIRTPLNAIIGMADLLSETELTAEQQNYVKIFMSAGDNLLNLINDILDLSKIEVGQVRLEKELFNLYELAEKTCEVMALKAHEKDLELMCYIAPDVPQKIVGDEGKLRQIFVNLLGNAIKFTYSGEILFKVEKDPEGTCLDGGECSLLFSICDTGIGIPVEKQEMIFDMFTQADSTTTRQYGGTGLGLAISKRLVEKMDGRIWVRSREGQGSTFYFTVQVGTERKGPEEPEVDLDGVKILIIDDNDTNRKILRKMVSSRGAVVKEVDNGISGLKELKEALLRGEPFKLVLLDYRMPYMNGAEVARQIANIPSLDGLPILMLTSDIRVRAIERDMEFHVDQCMIKPIKRKELFKAIQNHLEQKAKIETRLYPSKTTEDKIQTLKILLVEDSKDNQFLVTSYLKNHPYEIDIAANGENAIEKFKEGKYDLVLMDIQMPVMDGYTATRIMREWEKEHQAEKTPIIALTAYALSGDEQKSFDAGCDLHLTKPVRKKNLLDAICKLTLTADMTVDKNILDAEDQLDVNDKIYVQIEPEIEELIPGFIENRKKDIAKMLAAIEENNMDTIRFLGHSMKGVGTSYGFNFVTDIGALIEMEAISGDKEELLILIETLRDKLNRVVVM